MDLDNTVLIPAEPTGMTLFVTGLLTIVAYLALTNQLHLLRPKGSVARRAFRPQVAAVSVTTIAPRNCGYNLCPYDSEFAESVARIMRVAKQLNAKAVIHRPSNVLVTQ